MFVSVEMWLDIVRSWDWHEFNNLYEDSKHIQSVQIGISQKIQWAINLNLLRWSHPQHWHILELKLKRWFLASNLVSGSSGVACNTYPMPSNLIFKFDSNKYTDNEKNNTLLLPIRYDRHIWMLNPSPANSRLPSKHWFRPATSAVENKRNLSAAAPSSWIGLNELQWQCFEQN